MGYADPNFQVRRENHAGEAGGAATTEYGKFRTYQKSKLRQVHAIVTVAGTVVGHKLDVFRGTTSVGTIALGTSAAGVIASSGALNLDMASMEQVSVKTGADTVGKAAVVFEYSTASDAVRTRDPAA
ncbi:MAG TPA: hypothetical protein VIL30_16735 [Ramlibacter sp.]|jgi:hypothetical protein